MLHFRAPFERVFEAECHWNLPKHNNNLCFRNDENIQPFLLYNNSVPHEISLLVCVICGGVNCSLTFSHHSHPSFSPLSLFLPLAFPTFFVSFSPISSSLLSPDESVLLDFRQSLCSIVFSALSENSAGLQITSLRVLTALSQHTGETPDLAIPLPINVYLTNTFVTF